jgi:hypothetical protein
MVVLEAVLLALLLLLTFLTASFPVTNSDFLMHLASGRLLAQGGYQFGVDPFTFTTEGVYWANHSWLFDLTSWLLYRLEGGVVVLIVLKALALTGLTWLMFDCARQAGQRLWIPIACTLLAIVAASPRFFLQPAVVSMVFLGLTVWLLEKRRLLVLPLVVLLWVNLDAWFILGPLTIALYLLASLLPPPGKARAGSDSAATPELSLKSLGLVLAGCLVACLISPHHILAFTLPRELGLDPAAGILRRDPLFRGLFTVPWEIDYFQLARGLNVAGLAYHALALAGLLSFGVTFGNWRWSRVLVWVAFLGLSLINVRLVPFFAIVAGPIMAGNFLDLAREQRPDLLQQRPFRNWALTGRWLTVALILVLIVLTIPNMYVQAGGHRARRVGWWLEIDTGLRDAVLEIKQWQEEERIPPGQHWFTTAPEAVNYLVWFCPGEKGFLDQRLNLFGGVARDYLDACREFVGEADTPIDPSKPPPPALPRVFARYQLSLLLVHLPDTQRLTVAIHRLHSDPEQWVSCYAGGYSLILAWQGPRDRESGQRLADLTGVPADAWDYLNESRERTRKLRLDTDALAFGPDCVPAPATRPGPPLEWYELWWRTPPPEGKDSGLAFQYFFGYQAQKHRYNLRNQAEWISSLAGWQCGAATSGGRGPQLALLPATMLRSSFPFVPPEQSAKLEPFDRLILVLFRNFQVNHDQVPPAELYLGIRSARRSLVEKPDRAWRQYFLADFWLALQTQTREQACGNVPFVLLIRHTQIVGALEGLLEQEPPDILASLAHQRLADVLYSSDGYLEARLRHLKEYLRLCRLLGTVSSPQPGEKFSEAVKKLEERVKQDVRKLENSRNEYEVKSAKMPPLVKAQMAAQLGLCETAVRMLKETKPEDLVDPRNPSEARGAVLAVDLMLRLGRLKEARDSLTPADPEKFDKRIYGIHPLGVPAWDWFHVQLGAASGDYEEADTHLQEILTQLKANTGLGQLLVEMGILPAGSAASKQIGVPELVGFALGDVLLREATRASCQGGPLHRYILFQLQPAAVRIGPPSEVAIHRIQQEADLLALRAWLALEAGQIGRAREAIDHFRQLTRLGPDRVLIVRSLPVAALVQSLLASGTKPEPE